MRDQFDITVPCHALAQAAADRHPAEPDIGQRQRLHGDVGMMRGVAERVMDRADQRGAERQHADAIARGALGKQHHRVAAERRPTSRIRTPINAQRMRWYRCGMLRCSGRSNAMPINWNGSNTSVSATKANANDMTRIMKALG